MILVGSDGRNIFSRIQDVMLKRKNRYLCESYERTVLLGIQITCFAFYINTLGIKKKNKLDIYVSDWMVVCMPSIKCFLHVYLF